ncbi:uncharacterized protein [Drosophila pseudoobscura]|uniref:RING-type domain-containing protein n=1 Tax=Drosophila pseudoobscura pseudoobscura TaxID=46245 RepID=A0A6I8WBJ0_DROPS|nr:uncharacterized protein LOC117184897 [Drosophila pseudoobscura]
MCIEYNVIEYFFLCNRQSVRGARQKYAALFCCIHSDSVAQTVRMDYENIKFEFREGSRAGCSLMLFSLFEQQIYVKNKQLKLGETTYVCRVKFCKARVYLSSDKSRVYSNPEYVVHSHGPQSDEMKKISALSEIKLKCENNSNFDTKKVFNDVLAEKTRGEAEIEINYDSVKRTLQRKRQPFLPKSPSSAENVLEAFQDENIMNRFGITKGNTANQFYKKVYASSSFAYCIFSSDKVITLMQANIPEHNRHYLIDDRSKKIMDAMDLFERGEIDIQGFLTCTVSLADRFSKQDFFEGVDNESNLTGMSSDMKSSTSSLSSNASHSSQSSDKSLVQINPCNVCLCNPKSVLLRPCNHVNICGTCWDQIVAHNQAKNDLEENENIKPKCPSCNQEVEEAIRNVFIYN